MTTSILIGDCRETLRTLPAESVHCVVTSPPYWGLRDYGLPPLLWGGEASCEHEWGDEQTKTTQPNRDTSGGFSGRDQGTRGKQGHSSSVGFTASQGSFCLRCGAWRGSLGLEPDVDLYLTHIVEVFREVKRVLRDDGQLFLNIGDTRTKTREWCGIPHRMVFALQADGWRFEDEVVWEKLNCMPSSQTQRFTRSHEYVFMLNKTKQAYFDQEAVREPAQYGRRNWSDTEANLAAATTGSDTRADHGIRTKASVTGGDPSTGRNRRTVWRLPTQPFKGAHFATFPEALVEVPIKAGTSERGCCSAKITNLKVREDLTAEELEKVTNYLSVRYTMGKIHRQLFDPKDIAQEMRQYFKEVETRCGKPWERVWEHGKVTSTGGGPGREASGVCLVGNRGDSNVGKFTAREHITTGWRPGCECGGEPVPAVCLDPFGGSGTVALVASRLGRNAILCELNESYAEMSRKRIKDDAPMFNEVEVT